MLLCRAFFNLINWGMYMPSPHFGYTFGYLAKCDKKVGCQDVAVITTLDYCAVQSEHSFGIS